MKILSIDVGIKNLAYCIVDTCNNDYYINKWDVINLCESQHICQHIKKDKKNKKDKPCTNKAKYTKNNNFFCKIHAKNQEYYIATTDLNMKKLKKSKIQNIIEICNKYNINIDKPNTKNILLERIEEFINNKCFNIVNEAKADDFNLVQLGKSMQNHFDEILSQSSIDTVIIENQISPIANRMKTLQGMIAQYFIMKNILDIKFISSSNKLKLFAENSTKTTYTERKKLGISVTKEILEKNHNVNCWLDLFEKHRKKDDLADSFLQAFWYMNSS